MPSNPPNRVRVISPARPPVLLPNVEPPPELRWVNGLTDRLRVATDCSGLDAPIFALRALGLKHKHVFCSDIDSAALRFLAQNSDAETTFTDISKRDVAFAAECDLYVAGFPCQSFSNMNCQKKSSDARKELWRHCLEYIRSKRPSAFVLENVRALLTVDSGEIWRSISTALDELEGYHWEHKIIDAKEQGSPQSRARLYVVGAREGQDLFNVAFPEPIPLEVSCMDVIDLPEDKGNSSLGAANLSPCYQRMLQRWDFPVDTVGLLEFNGATITCRPYETEDETDESRKRALTYVKRDVAPCLVAHGPGHYCVNLKRLLTTNENLRLQGFDPSMVRCNDISAPQMQKMAGNTMNVHVLKRLFTAMLSRCECESV